jgi:hypothetical protein
MGAASRHSLQFGHLLPPLRFCSQPILDGILGCHGKPSLRLRREFTGVIQASFGQDFLNPLHRGVGALRVVEGEPIRLTCKPRLGSPRYRQTYFTGKPGLAHLQTGPIFEEWFSMNLPPTQPLSCIQYLRLKRRKNPQFAGETDDELQVSREGVCSGHQVARRLVDHLKLWGWKQATAPYLIAGWVCMQAYLGALDARPSVTLIGESGAGKSLLAKHIGLILNGTAYRIEDGAGTTSADLRQTIGKDAMTILLDEAEPGANQAQVAEQRAATMRRTLDMLRASFSASDGGNVRTTVKGSASGRAVDYSIRVAAMINAINRPDFDQADRNRFLLAEVVKEGRSAAEPSESGLGELGVQIRQNMWARWDEFRAIYSHLQGLDVGEARLRKTWGGPVAALSTLRYGEKWSENLPAIEQLMRAVVADQSGEDVNANESDQEKAYRALMGVMIDCEMLDVRGEMSVVVTRKRSIFEAFCAAKKANPRAGDTLAGKSLKRYGLARFDRESGPVLFVSDNPLLGAALKGTPWAAGQSIIGVLARLEGAVVTSRTAGADTRVRINGSLRSGVFILMPDTEEADKRDAAGAATGSAKDSTQGDDDVPFYPDQSFLAGIFGVHFPPPGAPHGEPGFFRPAPGDFAATATTSGFRCPHLGAT